MQKYLKLFLAIVIILLFLILACSTGGESPYEETQLIGSYSADSCLSHYRQYGDSSVVEIEVKGFDINVTHSNTIFDCCVDSIRTEFARVGDTLKLVEVGFLTVMCDCVCPYEVSATIGVAESGSYLVQIFKYNYNVLVYQEWVEVL